MKKIKNEMRVQSHFFSTMYTNKLSGMASIKAEKNAICLGEMFLVENIQQRYTEQGISVVFITQTYSPHLLRWLYNQPPVFGVFYGYVHQWCGRLQLHHFPKPD